MCLTDKDHDEASWLETDSECEGCTEPLKYGEECVLLRLVYPAPLSGRITLLDALEEDGTLTADPLFFCYTCWDAYASAQRVLCKDAFGTRPKSANPSPCVCSYCKSPINWGEYCTYATYGALDTQNSEGEEVPTFIPSSNETLEGAELVCMTCLGEINEEQDETIWPHMWLD